MENIKSELLKIEEEFKNLKKKVEKYHLLFIIIYFTPPVAGLIVFSRYFKELLGQWLKIFIFSIILLGVGIHFFLRYKFYRSKNRYKEFIENKIEELKKKYPKEKDLNDRIKESAKKIFAQRNIKLDHKNANNQEFWNLLFYNLDINV